MRIELTFEFLIHKAFIHKIKYVYDFLACVGIYGFLVLNALLIGSNLIEMYKFVN